MSQMKKETHETPQHTPKPEGHGGHKGKTAGPIAGGCSAWSCKKEAKQFDFCAEHYDHFKFGLIKKTGEPVSDYEKKFEHYQAHVAKRSAHKAA